MKSKKSSLLAAFFSISMVFAMVLSGCNNQKQENSESSSQSLEPQSSQSISSHVSSQSSLPEPVITLDYESFQIKVSETFQIKATVSTGETVTWYSLNNNVAQVNNGVVKGVSVGETEIIAKVRNVNKSAKVTVINDSVPILSLGREKVELEVGSTPFELSYTLSYDGKPYSSKVEWESENNNIATVKDGVITPLSIGETTITASTECFGYIVYDSLNVKVVADTRVFLSSENLTFDLGNKEEKTKVVTAKMVINGQEVKGATFTATCNQPAVNVELSANAIYITAKQLGDAIVSVSGTKDGVTATNKIFVTVQRQTEKTDYHFIVNTHVGDVKLDLPYTGVEGIYVNNTLVSLPNSPLTISQDWLSQQVIGQTVEAEVRLANKVMLISLEFKDDLRNVSFNSSIEGTRTQISAVQDGKGHSQFKEGEKVQVWNTSANESGWYGSTLEATVGGSRGDMSGFDYWVFDIVFTGEGKLGDQDGSYLYFYLSYGNSSEVMFRKGGANRDGLNIYNPDGSELLDMPSRNVRYTVVLSIREWVVAGQYVVIGHYTNNMECIVGNNYVCTEKYFKEEVRNRFLELSLDKTNAEVYVSESIVLTPIVKVGDTEDIVWMSSDEDIASVDGGIVTGYKNGTATISAIIGDKIATCTVKVSDKIEIVSNVKEIPYLVKGSTFNLELKTLRNGEENANISLTLTSEDTSIATVASDGTVKGVSVGETRIKMVAKYEEIEVVEFVEVNVVDENYVEVSETHVTICTKSVKKSDTYKDVIANLYIKGVLTSGPAITAVSDDESIVTTKVTGNKIRVSSTGKSGETRVNVTATSETGTGVGVIKVKVERGSIAATAEFDLACNFGDQKIDLSNYGEVLGIYDGDVKVSVDGKPSFISAAYTTLQADGSSKTLIARFAEYDVTFVAHFSDAIRRVKFAASVSGTAPKISDYMDGKGIPGFEEGDYVQEWKTKLNEANWGGSTIEATVDGKRGDLSNYEMWVFDIFFTGSGQLDDDNGGQLCILPRYSFDYSVYYNTDGPAKDWLHVYDMSGNEVKTALQRNVRYRFVVSLSGNAKAGEYVLLVHYTPNAVAYIGNNLVCSQEYYSNHLAPNAK